MKIRLVGAELFHAGGRTDGRTDRCDEASSRFLQFCELACILAQSRTQTPQLPKFDGLLLFVYSIRM